MSTGWLQGNRRSDGLRSVRLRRGSDEAESQVSVGKEARAATAARNGSPRGPVVQVAHNASGGCVSDGPKARLESSDGSPTYGPKARL
jgi:hypothetical protein